MQTGEEADRLPRASGHQAVSGAEIHLCTSLFTVFIKYLSWFNGSTPGEKTRGRSSLREKFQHHPTPKARERIAAQSLAKMKTGWWMNVPKR